MNCWLPLRSHPQQWPPSDAVEEMVGLLITPQSLQWTPKHPDTKRMTGFILTSPRRLRALGCQTLLDIRRCTLFIPHPPHWLSDSPGHQKVNPSSPCILWVTPFFSRILSLSLMPRASDSLTQSLGNEILWEYKKIHHPSLLPIAVISITMTRNNLERKGFSLPSDSVPHEGRQGRDPRQDL